MREGLIERFPLQHEIRPHLANGAVSEWGNISILIERWEFSHGKIVSCCRDV